MPGIVKIEGEFKKDDLLLIKDENNVTIGLGKATTDKDKIKNEKRSKPLIHYDYLYIYPEITQ